MSRRHHVYLAILVMSSLATQGCRPCYDSLFARGEAVSGFSVTEALRSAATPVALYATRENRDPDDRTYAVIANNSRDGSDNFMVTFYGFETPPMDRIAVTLSIPVGAAPGATYRIIRAFAAPE